MTAHEESKFRRTAVLAVLLSLGLIAGCLDVRTVKPGEPVLLGADEGLVFGRIRLFDRGREFDPWTIEPGELWSEEPVVRLALFQSESGRKRPDVPIESGGRFEWILPVGTYLLYRTVPGPPGFNEPLAAFQVPAGPEATDLGELRLDVSVDRPLSFETATYSVLSVDAVAPTPESASAYSLRHTDVRPVRKGALIVDPELGGLFDHWSREAFERILERHGVMRSGEGRR